MARAYTNDLVLFLDVANKENKRILDKVDLIWFDYELFLFKDMKEFF